MRDLLIVEFYKLWKQSKTYYALAAILFIELLILTAAYYQGNTMIDVLLSNLKETFYFEGNLLNGNLLIYLILNTLWFHLPLILMIIVAGILTSEYKDGTVQSVMLQPVVKWKFICSKYIVALFFTLVVVLLTALSSFVLSYLFFGKGDLIVYLGNINFFEADVAQHRLLWAFFVGTLSMLFFSVVSLTLAVIFKDATKTWIMVALFLVVNNVLLKLEVENTFYNFWFFPKLNNSWQLFFYETVPHQTIAHNSLVLGLYTLLFMIVGMLVFTKKDIG